jgi:hypothetical protein
VCVCVRGSTRHQTQGFSHAREVTLPLSYILRLTF